MEEVKENEEEKNIMMASKSVNCTSAFTVPICCTQPHPNRADVTFFCMLLAPLAFIL